FAGIRYLYNHGNQPNLHIAFLFNYAGHPWLSQKWVRKICDSFYGTEEIHGYGYGQDEDQGQLGGWFVMASMGLFDLKGLIEQEPSFLIGSPLFDKVTIKNARGNTIRIETINNAPDHHYVQSVQIDGERYDNIEIPYERL